MYRRFFAALLFVVGSSSVAGQSQPARGVMAGNASINPKDIALFASQHSHNRTAVIDSNNKILAYLTAQSGFVAIGPQGNLYDVPFNHTDVLTILHPPYKKVAVTIGFGEYTTVGVAVDQRTGTYAVTSINYNDGGSGSEVSIFTRDDKLCLTIPQPPEGFFWGGQAFDREGRLIVMLGTGSSNLVGEITGGCNANRMEFAALPSNIFPGTILYINKQDNIVFQSGDDVLTYAHPTHGQFSPPVATTALPHLSGLSCLTSDGQYLWAAVLQPDRRRRFYDLEKFRYPSGGAPVAQIHIDGAFSCATNPPLIP